MKQAILFALIIFATISGYSQRVSSFAFTEEHHFVLPPFGGDPEEVGCRQMDRPVVFTYVLNRKDQKLDSVYIEFTHKKKWGYAHKSIDFKVDSTSVGKTGNVMYVHTSDYNVVVHFFNTGTMGIQYPRDLFIYTRHTGKCDD